MQDTKIVQEVSSPCQSSPCKTCQEIYECSSMCFDRLMYAIDSTMDSEDIFTYGNNIEVKKHLDGSRSINNKSINNKFVRNGGHVYAQAYRDKSTNEERYKSKYKKRKISRDYIKYGAM